MSIGSLKQGAAMLNVSRLGIRTFTVSAVQLKKRDPTLPVPPKGAMSAYTLFVKDWFPSNKSSYVNSEGKVNVREMASAMGKAYTELGPSEKEEYTQKAKESKKNFDSEYRKWYTALTPEVIKAIEKDSGKKVSPPGGVKAKKLEDKNRPGNPGKPVTAFFEFMNELRNGEEGKGLSVAEMGKKGGEMWREMADDQKKRFRDIAADKKEKFVEWQKTLTS